MSRVLSVRVPDDLHSRFNEFCNDTQRSKAAVIEKLLCQYLAKLAIEQVMEKSHNKRFDSITKQAKEGK